MPEFSDRRPRQRRLPGVNWHKEAPIAQPHEMSFDQFARSPRTVWHSSYSEISPSDVGRPARSETGFHVGTQKAALERASGGTWTYGKGSSSRVMHPLRIKPGTMKQTTEYPLVDQGEDWSERDHGHWYRNDYEDKGSLSAILETPHDASSYLEFAQRAKLEGKGLHPEAERELQKYKESGGLHGPHFQSVHTTADLPPREKTNYSEQFHGLMDRHSQGKLFEGGAYNNYEGLGTISVGRQPTPEENEARQRAEAPPNSRLLITPKVKQEPWMKKS